MIDATTYNDPQGAHSVTRTVTPSRRTVTCAVVLLLLGLMSSQSWMGSVTHVSVATTSIPRSMDAESSQARALKGSKEHLRLMQKLRARAARQALQRARTNWSEAELSAGCPIRHPADHGLVNTGRRALVLYTFTSHDNLQDRQIELDNYLFFQAHGVVAPDTPTALFSAVDYIVLRSDPDRLAPSEDKNATNTIVADTTGVFECSTSGNVRIVETPSSPCDLCAIGRTVTALGGPDAVADTYEYIVVVNSGTRGPFYSEAPRSAGGPSPVTWIDDLALGGEKVYTGAIMTGTRGIAVNRPFLQSFAIAFPGSAMIPLHPVFAAGCDESTLPPHSFAFMDGYDANLHRDRRISDVAPISASVIRRQADAVRRVTTTMHANQTAERELAAELLQGVLSHIAKSRAADGSYRVRRARWGERKMRCVYRSEMQLTKSAMESTLPPMANDTSSLVNETSPTHDHLGGRSSSSKEHHSKRTKKQHNHNKENNHGPILTPNIPVSYPPTVRRPLLTAAQTSALSPALSTCLKEGHFAVRSLHHNSTVVNMGHAAVVMNMTHQQVKRGELHDVDPCRVVFLKFGGAPWRDHFIPAAVMAQVQRLTLVQWASRRGHHQASSALANVLQCPKPHQVRPLR